MMTLEQLERRRKENWWPLKSFYFAHGGPTALQGNLKGELRVVKKDGIGEGEVVWQGQCPETALERFEAVLRGGNHE